MKRLLFIIPWFFAAFSAMAQTSNLPSSMGVFNVFKESSLPVKLLMPSGFAIAGPVVEIWNDGVKLSDSTDVIVSADTVKFTITKQQLAPLTRNSYVFVKFDGIYVLGAQLSPSLGVGIPNTTLKTISLPSFGVVRVGLVGDGAEAIAAVNLFRPRVGRSLPVLNMAQVRSGLADTSSVIQVVNPINGRVFTYKYEPLSSLEDDSSMVVRTGSRRYILSTDVLTPLMFGAKGDSVTNDTKAVQKCFNWATANKTIDFMGLSYRIDSVTLITPYVSLRGSGAKVTGIIKIGDNTLRNYNAEISGFTFDLAGDPIKIKNVRKLTIRNNTFNGSVRAIHFVAGPTGIHYNGIDRILYNTFNDVNYCMYVARAAGAIWQVTSDCSFSYNAVNSALTTAVYIDGIDGFDATGNVFFTPSDVVRRVNKKYHIQILGQSDWVTISANKFFESGEESIHVTNCKNLVIPGNSFAWSGQKGVYPVISINGTIDDYSIAISGNSFKYFSGDVVYSGASTYGVLNVTSNVVYYANTFTNYFGSTDLSTIDHYVVNSANVNNVVREENTYRVSTLNLKSQKIGTLVKKYQRLQLFSSTSSKRSVIVTSGATSIDAGGIQNGNISTSSYGGKIYIVAKQAETTTANSAFYELTVAKYNSGATPTVTVVSSGGLTAGAGTSHPSFTFSISGDRLLATPVASTSGTFYLHMQTQGDLTLSE